MSRANAFPCLRRCANGLNEATDDQNERPRQAQEIVRWIMDNWLYEQIERVPKITDAQIAKMRHIEPLLKDRDSGMYRRTDNGSRLDPRNVSCIWSAQPVGEEFTFHTLNVGRILTQHHSSIFFKPSLAEVYAWLLIYMPMSWERVRFFHLGEARRIGGTTDFVCECDVFGGDVLVKGKEFETANGSIGWELVAPEST